MYVTHQQDSKRKKIMETLLANNDRVDVYVIKITRTDGRFHITNVQHQTLDRALYDKFKWDKLVRMDVLHINTVLFVSNEEQRIADFLQGIMNICEVKGEWDNIFKTEAFEAILHNPDAVAVEVDKNGGGLFEPTIS